MPYLNVGDGHELYYELYGNPKGIPVVFLHGGPGSWAKPTNRAYFNRKKYRVLFLDQRGCGRSRFVDVLTGNTTQELIEDIGKLMDHVGWKKAAIFGTSWGVLLGLCFGIKYPARVSQFILTGVFLGTYAEVDYMYAGGARIFVPDLWDEVKREFGTYRPLPQIWKQLTKATTDTARLKALRWFTLLEYSLFSTFEVARSEFDAQTAWKPSLWIAPYYAVNYYFLPDNFLVRNIHRIKSIPTIIVQGTRDTICPPVHAWTLHKLLSKSQIRFVQAGHRGGEKTPYIRAWLDETAKRK